MRMWCSGGVGIVASDASPQVLTVAGARNKPLEMVSAAHTCILLMCIHFMCIWL